MNVRPAKLVYMLICPYYMESKAQERLACLEDEAEQREKGCSLCTEELEGFKYGVRYCDGLPYIATEYKTIFSGLNYCPVCGKKLVE